MDDKISLTDFVPNLDSNTLDTILYTLKLAFQEIQVKKGTKFTFEELYRRTYNLVLHKQGKRLYIIYRQVVADHLKSTVLQQVRSAIGDNFLFNLNKEWCDYQTTTGMMCDILMYLDRIHVQQRSLVSTYNLSLLLFRDHIVREAEIKSAIRSSLLRAIDEERSGQQIDQKLIKNICEMLIKMGIDSREVYVSIFESSFLSTSGVYYRRKSEEYLSHNDACDFLTKIETHVEEECERVNNYLDKSTEPLILKVIEENLVRKNIRVLIEMANTGVWCMLKNCKFDDLARLYKVFSLIKEEGFKIIAETISEYIRKQSDMLISEDGQTSPTAFVEVLLNLKDQFDQIINRSFNDDQTLRRQVVTDLEYLVNLNRNCAEYISLFIHEQLINGIKNKNEKCINEILDKVMILHRYLEDKDIFEKYYQIHLARRLIICKHIAEDLELTMISRLKTEIGYMYTKNLDGMFKDKTLSKIITKKYNEHISQEQIVHPNFEMTISILTTAYWPLPSKTPTCNMPSELQILFENFKAYYLEKYPGKILLLQPQLSTALVTATLNGDTEGTERKYVLDVTTQQLCVLIHFNEHTALTYEYLLKETDMSEKDLKHALQYLTRGKKNQRLLLRSSESNSKVASPNDIFSLNPHYWSKYSKVTFYTMSYYESTETTKAERKMIKQSSEQDRRNEIDAAIVRIMKASKTMGHCALVSEVLSQVKTRFSPTLLTIKSEIETLISKDYIVRAENDRNTYIYVA